MTYFKRLITVNYMYIILIIMWVIIQNAIGVDGKGRIPFTASLLYCIYCFGYHQREFFSRPLIFWWLWVGYSLINTFYVHQSSSDNPMGLVTEVVSSPLMVCAVLVEYKKDSSLCLSFLGVILSIFIILCLMNPVDRDELGELAHGISAYGNIVPLTIVVAISVFSIKYVRSELSLKGYVVVAIFAFFLIFISATRKALGGCVIVLFFTYLAKARSLSLRNVVVPAIVFLALYVFGDYVESSQMVTRIQDSQYETDYDPYASNAFLKLVGDRAYMYVEGWRLFQENPICGIGLRNFYGKGYSDYILHTEYMVQLAECGLIGSLLFVAFYMNIIRRIFKLVGNKTLKAESIVNIGCIVSLLFISLTAWTYSIPTFFLYIGLVIAFIQVSEDEINYETINSSR